jgi:predicted small metal-binding protein
MDQIQVSCDCGFVSSGGKDDVVAEVQQHGKDVHNMDITPEQVVEMSTPA